MAWPKRPGIGHNKGPSLPPARPSRFTDSKGALPPWHRWYGLKRWKLMRARQLERFPFCKMCKSQGKTRPATVCDHVVPHRGSPSLFWRGKLQSLCASCHSRHKQADEIAGFADDRDDDGWPTDPLHPFNIASAKLEAIEGEEAIESRNGADSEDFNH